MVVIPQNSKESQFFKEVDYMADYLIGVDIGTAGTKSGLFNTEGVLLAQAYEESTLLYPRPGWVEQELEDFYSSAVKTIRRVMKKADIRPEEVAAITIKSRYKTGRSGCYNNRWSDVRNWND
jgi:xylulokinase